MEYRLLVETELPLEPQMAVSRMQFIKVVDNTVLGEDLAHTISLRQQAKRAASAAEKAETFNEALSDLAALAQMREVKSAQIDIAQRRKRELKSAGREYLNIMSSRQGKTKKDDDDDAAAVNYSVWWAASFFRWLER